MHDDWLASTAHAFERLANALAGRLLLERVQQAFELVAEPSNEAELISFRCFLCELLLDATCFGRPVVRRDALESILREWTSIRRHRHPVALLRHALALDTRATSKADLATAEAIRDLLERRYAERLHLRDVAEELVLSESKMNRCFRLAYGTTIHQHLRMIRVSRGLDLVTQGVKIEAAALSVGFKSKKDFYRGVQRFTGCTPAQFRFRIAGLDTWR